MNDNLDKELGTNFPTEFYGSFSDSGMPIIFVFNVTSLQLVKLRQ